MAYYRARRASVLATAPNLPVIAEGVETESREARLPARANAVTEIQGYFIGKPQPIAAYSPLIGAKAGAAEAPAPKPVVDKTSQR